MTLSLPWDSCFVSFLINNNNLHFKTVFCLLLCKLISGQVMIKTESGESGESSEFKDSEFPPF